MKKKELAKAEAAQSFVEEVLAQEMARAKCPMHGLVYRKGLSCQA